jgi:valyl-tRNA synthetase
VGGAEFELVREAVSAIRQIRSDYAIPPGRTIDALLVPAAGDGANGARRTFDEESALIGFLARSDVRVAQANPGAAAAQVVIAGGAEVVVPLAGVIDVDKECGRLRAELQQLEKQLGGLRQRLANESFLSRAKPEVVDAERQKERDWSARRDQLARRVQSLCGA